MIGHKDALYRIHVDRNSANILQGFCCTQSYIVILIEGHCLEQGTSGFDIIYLPQRPGRIRSYIASGTRILQNLDKRLQDTASVYPGKRNYGSMSHIAVTVLEGR